MKLTYLLLWRRHRGLSCRAAKALALGACYAGSFTIPGVSTYMSFCVVLKALPANFQWTISSIDGNAQATITNQLAVEGDIGYDFNFSPFNKFKIGAAVFGILTQCLNLELKGDPAASGTIPNDLAVKLTKQQAGKASNLNIAIQLFQATVNLSGSPGLAVLTDFKNYFTCNLGYSVAGFLFAMAHVVPEQVIPDKFRDYFDVLTKGRIDSTFEVKPFTIPLSFKTKTILGESQADMLWGRSQSILQHILYKISDNLSHMVPGDGFAGAGAFLTGSTGAAGSAVCVGENGQTGSGGQARVRRHKIYQ